MPVEALDPTLVRRRSRPAEVGGDGAHGHELTGRARAHLRSIVRHRPQDRSGLVVDGGVHQAVGSGFDEPEEALGGQSVALFFLKANDGWLETSGGVAAGSQQASIYATTDGGTDWRLMSTDSLTNPSGGSPGALPAACDKTGISFASPALGWATLFCDSGGIGLAGTSNGGRSWGRRFHIPPVSGVDRAGAITSQPVFSSPSLGALGVLPATGPGGGRATVYSTSDSGANWIQHQPPGHAAGSPCVVDTVSASTWVIGCGRTVFTTTDGGQGWTTQHSEVNLSSHEVDFVSARVGWAWTSGIPVSRVLRTVDGGRTWRIPW